MPLEVQGPHLMQSSSPSGIHPVSPLLTEYDSLYAHRVSAAYHRIPSRESFSIYITNTAIKVKVNVKTSIYIARFMHQAPLTR